MNETQQQKTAEEIWDEKFNKVKEIAFREGDKVWYLKEPDLEPKDWEPAEIVYIVNYYDLYMQKEHGYTLDLGYTIEVGVKAENLRKQDDYPIERGKSNFNEIK